MAEGRAGSDTRLTARPRDIAESRADLGVVGELGGGAAGEDNAQRAVAASMGGKVAVVATETEPVGVHGRRLLGELACEAASSLGW